MLVWQPATVTIAAGQHQPSTLQTPSEIACCGVLWNHDCMFVVRACVCVCVCVCVCACACACTVDTCQEDPSVVRGLGYNQRGRAVTGELDLGVQLLDIRRQLALDPYDCVRRFCLLHGCSDRVVRYKRPAFKQREINQCTPVHHSWHRSRHRLQRCCRRCVRPEPFAPDAIGCGTLPAG